MRAAVIHHPVMHNTTLPEPWETALAGWTQWLRLSGMAKSTITLRIGHVRSIARRTETGSPADLTLDHLITLFGGADWSREHRRSMRTAIIGFLGWCVDRGHAAQNIGEALPRVPVPKATPRPAPEATWEAVLASAPPRERLMIRLAGELGMRRAEVARCHLRDLVQSDGRWSLIVVGKGGRQRIIPVPGDLAAAIREQCPGGWVFPNTTGTGPLTAQWVGIRLSRLLGPDCSMHQLRHRFASLAYQRTQDLRALQRVLGHSSLSTTERYVQHAEDAERRLVDSVRPTTAPVSRAITDGLHYMAS